MATTESEHEPHARGRWGVAFAALLVTVALTGIPAELLPLAGGRSSVVLSHQQAIEAFDRLVAARKILGAYQEDDLANGPLEEQIVSLLDLTDDGKLTNHDLELGAGALSFIEAHGDELITAQSSGIPSPARLSRLFVPFLEQVLGERPLPESDTKLGRLASRLRTRVSRSEA